MVNDKEGRVKGGECLPENEDERSRAATWVCSEVAFGWRQPGPINEEHSRCKYVAPSPVTTRTRNRIVRRKVAALQNKSFPWSGLTQEAMRIENRVRITHSVVERDTAIWARGARWPHLKMEANALDTAHLTGASLEEHGRHRTGGPRRRAQEPAEAQKATKKKRHRRTKRGAD